MEGCFQELKMDMTGNLSKRGPGDHDFIGGRWWVDVNGDDIQDEGNLYFSCPLLGPGLESP